jgi:aminodeoxyfutalosine synthase
VSLEELLEPRILPEKAAEIFSEVSTPELGFYADSVKRRLYGDAITYVRNMHLNITNICRNSCRFCSFKKKKGEPEAYVLSIERALELVAEAKSTGITEVHLVNALNPDLGLDFYTNLIREIKSSFPELTVKGLTAVEIDFLAQLEDISYDAVIDALIEAGVKLFPGGGAEIFDPGIRRLLGTKKTSKEKYLTIHELIHKRGIKSNATMLYGHFEKPQHIVQHLLALRELQDKTNGFSSFIPLRFVPDNAPLKVEPKGANYDLKIIAFSRLFLDNFPHIKAYWVSLTPEVAQVALHYGADDIDGTIYRENIIRAAGIKVKPCLTADELEELIKGAGLKPVERDSFFNAVKADA